MNSFAAGAFYRGRGSTFKPHVSAPVSPETRTCSASLRCRNIAGARTSRPPPRPRPPRPCGEAPRAAPSLHPFRRGVSRDLAAIVYQWPEPHTRAARINIIISKSKAGGPRPVSVLLSFSLPSPSLRASRGTHSSSASFRSSLFRPSIARSVSLCRIRRSARWMGTRLSPSALPFLLRAARARVASTHTRARCVLARRRRIWRRIERVPRKDVADRSLEDRQR